MFREASARSKDVTPCFKSGLARRKVACLIMVNSLSRSSASLNRSNYFYDLYFFVNVYCGGSYGVSLGESPC